MSPHEFTKYRQAFNAAAEKLGWTWVICERDEDRAWTEDVWMSANGQRLFDESDVEP